MATPPDMMYCVCKHSQSAHRGTTGACAFCKCEELRDPANLPLPPPAPLSDAALRALEILSNNPAFKTVPIEHLKAMAQFGRRRLFLEHAIVMEQGEPSDVLFILVKGAVSIDKKIGPNQTLHLAELGPGDIIGEMGVLQGDPRSATATALADLETLELSAALLKKTFREDKEVLLAVMTVVNQRLQTTDDLVETSLRVALSQLSD
ncbi:MAG: cyclic nucleotide-binding domain-containing protein [Chloroflexota bacterium]